VVRLRTSILNNPAAEKQSMVLQKNKKKQREIAEISKANACEPRVSIRKKDGTTELLIKPYPLMDYAKDPFIDGHWALGNVGNSDSCRWNFCTIW